MAKTTDKLGLFLYDKTSDINEPFDLDKGLNNNFEIIDETFKNLDTQTGEPNKLFKFSDIANTLKAVFKILKTSTTAFRVANDSDVEVFNVDTSLNEITGSAISMNAIAKKLAKRDLNGEIANVFNTAGIFGRKVFDIPSFNRVVNENIDIIIPLTSAFIGQLKVKIISGKNYGDLTGVLEKTFQLFCANATTLTTQGASYSNVEGLASSYIAIKNAVISGSNLKITIVKKEQIVDLLGKIILELDSIETTSQTMLQNASISAVYIADNSSEPLPILQSKSLALATQDFAKGVLSIGASGYQKFPSGLILQWNSGLSIAVGAGSSLRLNFPLTFPNTCWYVDGVWGSDYQFTVSGIDKNGFTVINNDGTTRYLNSYFAIGL